MIKVLEHMKSPLNDKKIDGKSLLTIMTVQDYLSMTDIENNPYQRNILGVKQYSKLVDDLLDDTVMPPISVVYDGVQEEITQGLDENKKFIILDGLQRTNCIMHCKNILEQTLEAKKNKKIKTVDEFLQKKIYVEIWGKLDLKTILYKMVVLNTGQKKMDYAHQLDILNNSLKMELTKQGIDIITVKEKKNGSHIEKSFELADVTEGLVSYINGIPISGKKNAAEFLFEKLNVGLNTGEDAYILDSIYNDSTYENLIWTLKNLMELLDEKYGSGNPLRKYNTFLSSFLASLGNAYKKSPENLEMKKAALVNLCRQEKDPFSILVFEEYYSKFKTGIGEKRRKFIFETFRDFFISKTEINRLEWDAIYERYF
jgi:hypothetical protein